MKNQNKRVPKKITRLYNFYIKKINKIYINTNTYKNKCHYIFRVKSNITI